MEEGIEGGRARGLGFSDAALASFARSASCA